MKNGLVLTNRHAVYFDMQSLGDLDIPPAWGDGGIYDGGLLAQRLFVKQKDRNPIEAEVAFLSKTEDLALLRPKEPMSSSRITIPATFPTDLEPAREVLLVGAAKGVPGDVKRLMMKQSNETTFSVMGDRIPGGWSGSPVILRQDGRHSLLGIIKASYSTAPNSPRTGGLAIKSTTCHRFVQEALLKNVRYRSTEYTVRLKSVTLSKSAREKVNGGLGLDEAELKVRVTCQSRFFGDKPLAEWPTAKFEWSVGKATWGNTASSFCRIRWYPGMRVKLELLEVDVLANDLVIFSEWNEEPDRSSFPLKGTIEWKDGTVISFSP